MLFENQGLNQYQSLSNRFFDYIMAGIPQVCVNYPQYNVINEKYRVAVLINDTKPETIATALNNLLSDPVTYDTLSRNCIVARQELNWLQEEKVLVKFYRDLFAV
jgi:glycosyltransferase involved in cell wall biosynthesis